MSPDRNVLEHNLERLLRRAYEPVRARDSFRARLERDVLAGAARQKPARLGSSPLVRVAVAASIAIVALVGWSANRERLGVFLARAFGAQPSPQGLEEILARGDVAWRAQRDASWSAAPSGVETAPIAFEGRYLEIVTPPSDATQVGFAAPAQAWNVFPATRLALEARGGELTAWLSDGGLLARRAAGEPALGVHTSEGELRLRDGAVRVAFERPQDPSAWPERDAGRWVRVSVRSGSVEVGDATTRRALARGREAFLVRGEVLLPGGASGAGAGREEAPSDASGAPDEVQPGPPPSLVGSVRAAGQLLERFRVVTLEEVSIPQTATPHGFDVMDAAGEFSVAGLTSGRYFVFVLAEGYAVARSGALEVVAGATTRVEFALDPGSNVRGLVLDDVTELPVPDAYVVSESDSQIAVLSLDATQNTGFDVAVRSDRRGTFTFERLASGSQWLRASAPGYGAAWVELVDLPAGERRDAVVFRLRPAGRIVGSVIDERGVPAADSVVLASTTDFERRRPSLTYRRVTTDTQGEFVIPDLGAGDWAVLHFGGSALPGADDAAPDFRFARVAEGETTQVKFHAARTRLVLHGTVRDAKGRPVAQRNLMIAPVDQADPPPRGAWTSFATGPDGSYRVPDLEPGWCELFVSGTTPAELGYVGRLEILPGTDAAQDITLPAGAIAGYVHDAVHDAPMTRAIGVLLRRGDPEATFVAKVFTDEQGRYRAEYLQDGAYDLWMFATRDAYGEERHLGLELRDGQLVEGVDFTLRAGGSLRLEIVDADGRPLPRAAVAFYDVEGVLTQFGESSSADEQGVYSVAGLRPGRWRVVARARGFESAEATTEVLLGERAELRVVLARK